MADTKITELPAASTLGGTEIVPIVQSSSTAKTTAADIAALNNPMTTAGDIVIGGTSGAPTRLAAGTDGYVLTLSSGAPAWAAAAWINPMTTAGDLIVGSTSGAASRLGVGTDGQVLTLVSGSPAWASAAFVNPMTTAGDVIIGGADGAANRLAAGTEGQVLKMTSGSPAWGTNTASVAWGAITGTLADQTDLGTAAAADTTDFATAAQGALADTATQPGDLAAVATSGDYDDLTNKPARETATAVTSSSGVVAIDYSLGDYFTLALSEAITSITFSNLPGSSKGATILVQITQDSTPRTVAWPSSFTWSGSEPAVSTGDGDVDVLAITTFDNGTTWRATLAKDFA